MLETFKFRHMVGGGEGEAAAPQHSMNLKLSAEAS